MDRGKGNFMKLSDRKKEIFLMVFTNLLLQFVTFLCGFILPPLIIQKYGSSTNGMISSINQFISYLNLVEAGVGGASIVALYKPLIEKKYETANKILSVTRKFYNKSGLIFLILIIVLAFFYPIIVKEKVDYTTTFLMVLVLGISGISEFFLIGKYKVLLTADKRIYIISIVQALALLVATFISVILIRQEFERLS